MNVIMLVFNRPDQVARVFAMVRASKPRKLLVVSDGPRPNHPEDVLQIAAVHEVVKAVDWDCEVFRNYAGENMGCRKRVVSGLNWAFELVEEGIILEEDCLPSLSFFRFCDDLLRRYREDMRVMHIGGNNFQRGRSVFPWSYYFTRYSHIWGWATWRRAWKLYDAEMKSWPEVKAHGLLTSILPCPLERRYWEKLFDRQYRGSGAAWSYAWQYACWANQGVAVAPCVNLVSNIGGGVGATHTIKHRWFVGLPAVEMQEIAHPPAMLRCQRSDDYTFKHVYKPDWWERICATGLNPWWYSQGVRKVPVIGRLWANYRDSLKQLVR